jgi:fructokinase
MPDKSQMPDKVNPTHSEAHPGPDTAGDRTKPRIAALGEVLWDLLPSGKELGGAPANFVLHARRLGAEAVLVSRVGRDSLGRELLQRLAETGMPLNHIGQDGSHPTGTVDVQLDPRGQPRYTIQKNAAWDFIPWEPALERLAGRVDAVCFGSLGQRAPGSRAAIERFLASTKKTCVRVFDINLRPPHYTVEIIRRSLEKATVLKLNQDELELLGGLLGDKGSETQRLKRLQQRFGLALIALTRGERGSRLVAPDGDCEHPGFPVSVKDTVGAGDAFTAALTLGWLQGLGLEEINAGANRTAAEVCGHKGAWLSLPVGEEKPGADGKGPDITETRCFDSK